jgi:hypothetical protein
LNNRNTAAGANDVSRFKTGAASASSIVIAGDWDGDGRDSVGLYDSTKRVWYLLGDRNPDGSAEEARQRFKTPARRAWQPIVGDWDGDGEDSVGLYDAARSRWYLNNRNRAGDANDVLSYQTPGVPKKWRPIVGNWDGSEPEHPDLLVLDSSQSGGATSGLRVQVGIAAAGARASVDATLDVNEQHTLFAARPLQAKTSISAGRRVDRLTAVMPEHGYRHVYSRAQVRLMREALSVGVRGRWTDFPSPLNSSGKDQQDALDAIAVDAVFSGGP